MLDELTLNAADPGDEGTGDEGTGDEGTGDDGIVGPDHGSESGSESGEDETTYGRS